MLEVCDLPLDFAGVTFNKLSWVSEEILDFRLLSSVKNVRLLDV